MTEPSGSVGPVLEPSELGLAVLAAIQAGNAGVQVQDRGAYLRVLAPGRCVVTCIVLMAPVNVGPSLQSIVFGTVGFL